MKSNFLKFFKACLFSILFAFNVANVNAKAVQEELPLLDFDARIFPELSNAGMVATQEARATQVGVEILEQGGNAVDAAVAVGFALAVTLPRAGNIGGGGFMMIYDSQSEKVSALDYREKAPRRSHRNMYLDKQGNVNKKLSRYSILASGVPGTVAGLIEAHRKYGSMPLPKLVEPSIKLARSLPVTVAMAQSLNARVEYLSKHEATKKIFVRADGRGWRVGDVIQQTDLASTLEIISKSNGKAFYSGSIARILVDFFKSNGGLISEEDLSSYQAIWRKPVSANFGEFEIYSMPPPSSGGIHLIQLLNIIKQFPIKDAGANSALTSHIKTEAMKFAYADRSQYLGDPDFVNVPIERLASEDYAQRIAKQIKMDRVLKSSEVSPGHYFDNESPQTTHYSIIDKDGNMVANTYTLNFSFGSAMTVPGTGMLLNNEMDDFSAKPGVPNAFGLLGGEANSIEPMKRPLSSMTPVLVLKKGRPWLTTGSPGGSRIITTVLNFLLNRMVFNLNIAEATMLPRIHHQWYPEKLFIEKGFPFDTAKVLEKKGHPVEYRRVWGSLQSVEFDNGYFMGFSDTRRPGAMAKGIFKKQQK